MCVPCRLRECIVDNGEKRRREVDNGMIMCYYGSLFVGCYTLPQYRQPVSLECSSCTCVLVAGVSSFHSMHPKLISVFLTRGNPGTLLKGLCKLVCNFVTGEKVSNEQVPEQCGVHRLHPNSVSNCSTMLPKRSPCCFISYQPGKGKLQSYQYVE
jgi:hypothetical protein